MRIEKITFQQTFPTGQFQNQKLGMDIVLSEADTLNSTAQEAFEYAKKIVNEAFEKLNPQINWSDSPFDDPSGKPIFSNLGVIIPSETKPRDTVDNIIAAINSSKNLVTLKWLEPTGENAMNERIMNAYNEKLKSFQ